MVSGGTGRFRQDRSQGCGSRIIVSVTLSDGPIYYDTDALPDSPGGLGYGCPDGCQHCQHVGAADMAYRKVTQSGEGVRFQTRRPLGSVPGVAPRGLPKFDHPGRSLYESWHRPAPLMGQWIAALACQLPVGQGRLSRFCQRYGRIAAQSQLVTATPDRDALDPTTGTGGIHPEIQAAPSACIPGRFSALTRAAVSA